MKHEHKYAKVLRWIADGEKIQARAPDTFKDCDPDFVLHLIGESRATNPENFRIKPKTINVNGKEVPAGEKNPLRLGTKYFVPVVHEEDLCAVATWSHRAIDISNLLRGLVHLNDENAISHAKAMLNID